MTETGRPGLLVDIDGVLADTIPLLCEATRWATGGRVDLQPEHIAAWDWTDNVDAAGNRPTAADWREALARFHHARPGEQAPLDEAAPVPGSIEALGRLAGHFDISVATARADAGDCRRQTVAWLGRHLRGIPHALHFVRPGRKHQIGGVVAAVDDHYDQAVAFAHSGVSCCLLERPYNAESAGRPGRMNLVRCPDWAAVEAALGRVRVDQLRGHRHEGWMRAYQPDWSAMDRPPAPGKAMVIGPDDRKPAQEHLARRRAELAGRPPAAADLAAIDGEVS